MEAMLKDGSNTRILFTIPGARANAFVALNTRGVKLQDEIFNMTAEQPSPG